MKRRLLVIVAAFGLASSQASAVDATGSAVIFAGESPAGAVDSVNALRNALLPSVNVIVVTELSDAAFTNPQSLWVLNGTYPNNHVLTVDEGQFLADKIVAGIPVYLESADCWGFDPETPFWDYDGVDVASVIDGDDTFVGMYGATYHDATFGALSSSYTQDAAGSDFTDQLAVTSSDAAGSNSGAVWYDDGAGGGSGYATGVYYDTAPGYGKVLVQSWEFGGYNASQSVLAQRYQLALGVAHQAFGRGDVNRDSQINIADASALLAVLFTGAAPLGCEDAADINDDGGLDVSDPVYLLTYLFSSGPSIPAPSCGIDPTPDALTCQTGTPCLI